MFSVEQVIGVIGGGLVALVGFVFHGFSSRLDAMERRQRDNELHFVGNYVKESDLAEKLKPLFHKLDRMESKLDDANFKLANKQDRP